MIIKTALILERKDLCRLHKSKNRKDVTTSDFTPSVFALINKAEIVIFEGILLTSRF